MLSLSLASVEISTVDRSKTSGSHRSFSFLLTSFAPAMNPVEVTPSEFNRQPWGVCRWFKTLGACNVSPIEHVRFHKGPYRVYIRPVSSDFLRGARASKPANRVPPCTRSVSDGGTVDLLPGVDVCMNHWPIFITIGLYGIEVVDRSTIIYWKRRGKTGKPVKRLFN